MLDFKQKISKEVWTETYKWETENVWQDTAIRISKDNSRAEEKDQAQFWSDQFLSIIAPMRYIPGGRIISNAGLKLKGTTYINCFPEYINVLTQKGYIPISEVQIGDYVLTHKKRWRKVVNTLSKFHEGEVDIYKSSHIREDIVVTKEHPFYQGNEQWENSETNNKLVIITEEEPLEKELLTIDILYYLENVIVNSDHVWYETQFTGGNGAIVNRVGPKVNRKILLDEDLAYAFGRFVGDGSTWNQYKKYDRFDNTGFNIVFNENELASLDYIKTTLEKAFNINLNINISGNGGQDWHYLRVSNPILATFFSKNFGEDSYTKKIPDFIWRSPKNIKYKFILGLLDADGCVDKRSELKLVLNNEKLINDILSLANICGIHFKKRKYHSSVDKYSAFMIYLSGINSEQIRKDMQKHYGDDRLKETFKNNGISSITKLNNNEYSVNKFEKYSENYSGYVYNISVEEDESYIVNDIVVHNCYVGGFSGKNQDSIEGIYRALANQAKTLKSEGGYGFCIDVIRPRGFYIEGIANYSPGPVEIAKLWNTSSAVITSGANIKIENKKGKKKIRKGAQMITMSCWHPSIEEFITAKQTPGVLDKFNMSVLITDEFIEAVKKNKKWDLIFPDTRFEKYDDEWNGNIVEWQAKDYPVVIVKTFENANILWDLIMSSTYNRNEPGVIFIDRVNELNNLFYSEYIDATNPSLRKGTKVLTKNGIFNIEDLEGKEFLAKNLNGEWSTSKCFLSGKDKQLYKIQLDTGTEIYATKEHKWPCLLEGGGWGKVTTNLLKEGNFLPLPYKSTLDFEGDSTFTQEEGQLFGWLYGDGWISDRENKKRVYGLCFSDSEKYIAETVIETLNLLKKQPSNIKERKGMSYLQVTDHNFDTLLRDKYSINKKEFGLPKKLWNSNDNFIKGFISGLFSADGFVGDSKIVLTSKHERLALDVQKLLSFYGIKSRIRKSTATNVTFPNGVKYNKLYTRYDLSIHGFNAYLFQQTFKLMHKEKQLKLDKFTDYKEKRKTFENVIRIKSIELTNIHEDVWDISVFDDTHCFQIEFCITGNCGEQPLSKDSSCNLGSLNLVKYINADKTGWDYDLLRKDIPIAVRFQDNINDLTNFPLKEQKELAQKNRRIGIGYMGYGSALYLLQIPYGSKKALKITEELCKFVTNEIYRASTMIAKEKGRFPGFTEQYLESKFIKLLDKDVQELIAEHGTRCSHHTMIAPTGNTGILAENVSGGLEPVVSPEYTRTIIVNSPIDGLIVPMDIDWDTQKFTNTENEWTWTKEGDEHILKTKFNGTTYKIDRNRGLTREERVMDYAVLELGDKFNPDADYVKTIFNLGVQEHVDTMAIFAKWIDAGISKCLEKGTLIPTSEGLIKIEDFTTNEKPDSFIKITKNIKTNSQKILSHYYAGIKQATRITLDNGAEISGASDTHKVKTAEGWKVLSEIKKGDIILGQLLESHGRGNLPILWDSKYKSNANRITIPNKMSVEFAEWIGMICADGHSVLSTGNVGLTCKNTKVENRFIELTKIIFKKEPVKSMDKRNQVVVLYLTSRNLVRFIENFIGKGAYNKYIPSQILQGNKEEKKAFLSGISLDGYYKPKFGLYIYEGMSKELAYQTSELCRSFGLPKVYIGKKRNDFGTVYGVMVSNLLQKEIICIEEHKNKQVVYQSYNVFIGNLSDTTKIKANHPSYSAIRSMWQRKKTLCKIETATKFGWNTSILAYKVTRVEEDGLKEMYDIELDGNHEYIVNGMISHNTINLPNDYSYESFKNIYMDAYDTKFIKGFTTYRIGTMTSVLSVDTKQEDKEEEFRTTTATKRPKSLDADIFKVTVSGEKWIVFVSRIKDRPYELFAGKISLVDIPSSIKDGKIVKTGKGHYEFEHAGEVIISDITKVFQNDVNDSITRLVSTSLRHGAEVKFIVEQLNKAKGVVTDFSKCLARALKHYIKDGETQNEKCPSCGKQTLIFQQGCTTCTDCGYSRCG
jgi:ribonucleoside-diphosphate reductase alpha chain